MIAAAQISESVASPAGAAILRPIFSQAGAAPVASSAAKTAENPSQNNVTIRAQVPMTIRANTPVRMVSFNGLSDGQEHVALIFGRPEDQTAPLVRMHSSCMTGDILGSHRCDCGDQLNEAITRMAAEGGIILYLFQEGRGIGLYNKLDAYHLQITQGLDTYEANKALGFAADARDFTAAAEMLGALGVTQLRLLSNNPEKARQLTAHGLEIVEAVPTGCHVHEGNHHYLNTKQTKGAHRLRL